MSLSFTLKLRATGGVTRAGCAACLLFAYSCPIWAQLAKPRDLSEFSLEDLMNIQVTSVSAKEQKLSKAPAAVFVLTAEDIRRSGALNIPDVLRLVPGINVEQVSASSWAISVRGFADRYANKVLVLIDGRSVYSPMYSGVVWDAVDVPLEDIDRIEVIRGPGGTVWGANAVNGVINILTKDAEATEGGLGSMGTGTEHKAVGYLRYGARAGRAGAYRVFARFSDADRSEIPRGGAANDSWYLSHGGFRSDWSISDRDSLTVQGDFQRTVGRQLLTSVFTNALPLEMSFPDRIGMTTGNILGRWKHTLANGSEMSWQVYDDSFRRSEQGIRYSHNIVDAAFQHHLSAASLHDLVWGAEARSATTQFLPGYSVAITPTQKTDRLLSAFVQDEVRLTNRLSLTAGAKFEHNDYTGFEWEPSAQILWTPRDRHAIWFSAARAIRQPSREDAGVRYDLALIPGPLFAVAQVRGNPNLRPERLYDFEAGYRAQLGKRFSADLDLFLSFYRDLAAPAPQLPYFTTNPQPPHIVQPLQMENSLRARSYGAEFSLNYNLTPNWRVSPAYSALQMKIRTNPGFPDSVMSLLPLNSPEHQFQLRSFLNLRRNLEWDQTVAYVGGLMSGSIPAYTRVDTRLGWRIGEVMELSVTGQNLLRPRHAEFPDQLGLNHTQIERSAFGKITWQF